MSSLNYIKNTIFDNTKCDFVINTEILNACNIDLVQFKKEWNHLRYALLKTDNIDEIKEVMHQMTNLYLPSIWNKMNDRSLLPHHVWHKLSYMYYKDNFHQTDNYIDNILSFYEHYSVTSKLFDYKNDKKFKNNLKVAENENKNSEVMVLAQRICDKFSFSHVSLSSDQSNYVSLEFLQTVEKDTEKLCKDMGIDFKMIGLNKNIGLSETERPISGSYDINKRTLSLRDNPHGGSLKSTILHEWIHAIDNLIFSKVAAYTEQPEKKHELSSEYIGIVEKPTSILSEKDATFKAYHEIRSTIHSICNDNVEEVNNWIKQKEELATTKFWSIILGEQYYGLSELTKNKLCQEEVKNSVINYCISPDNNKVSLVSYISHLLTMSHSDANDLINKHHTSIIEKVGEYVKDSQNSPILSKSFILRSCDSFITRTLHKVSRKVLNFDKSSSDGTEHNHSNDDYYSQRSELLARYFEANVYPIKAMISNILSFTIIYPFKDKDFSDHKENLMEYVSKAIGLEKRGIIKNIHQMRTAPNQICGLNHKIS